MKLSVRIVLALLTIATTAMAQVITPVWVQHINGEEGMSTSNRLPILIAKPGKPENNDGTSEQVGFGKLLPYDSTRFLLYVRENGINEGTASPADLAIAAQFPDASLIWIDAATGAPFIPPGKTNAVALTIGVTPIAVTGQGSQLDFFHEFGIAADGTIYSGHKNKILRYAKTGVDTWSSTPTCAWTEPTVGATDCTGAPLDDSVSGDGNQSVRWREFRVTGSGTNTVLFCGGGTWRQGSHTQKFKTADGTNFYPVAKLNSRDNGTSKNEYALGGQASSVIRYGLDPSHLNVETVYTGHYPGTGYEARPNRYMSDPDNPGRIITPYSYTPTDSIYIYDRGEAATNGLPAFSWEAAGKDGLPQIIPVDGDKYYDGNWSQAIDGNASLDYIVSYSMPSWNNQYGQLNGTNYHKPGWVGAHRLDGSIALNSGWKLPCTEDNVWEPANGDTVGNDWAYCGDVTLVPDTNAPANLKKATVFWSGGAYGFGVFTVQNVAAAILTTPPPTITLNELDTLTLNVGVSGSPNQYQWTRNGLPLNGAQTNADGSFHYPPTVLQGTKKPNLSLPGIRASESGLYRLSVVNPISGSFGVDVNVNVTPDTTPPVVVSAGSMETSTIDVCFNEALDPATATVPANYTFVSPVGGNVVGVELRKNSKAVRLTVTGLSPATAFTINVKNVRDYTGTAVTAIPLPGQNISGTVQNYITTIVDIDVTTVAGVVYSCAPGEYEVEAGGTDIWNASDVFNFAYKEVSGDFDVRAQIAQVTTPGNRSGIMLRESTSGASRFNYVTWNPGNLLGFHVRETDGTTPIWGNPENNWLGFGPPPNVWMRLKRVGNVTSAFRSTDGINWTAFGTTTNAIADPALLGLATAANAGANAGYTRYAGYGPTPVPSVLNISNQGGVLTVSWTGPGVLKSSTSVTGPYTPELSQSNPQVVQPTGGSKFFKLE